MNKKLITAVVAILALIGIVLAIMAMMTDPKEDLEAASNAASPLVNYSLILLVITALVAVVGSIFSLLKNPSALKKALLGLVALVVVFGVSYMLSNGEQVADTTGKVISAADSQVTKLTSTGIIFSGILMLFAGGFFIWDLLKGLVKS